MTINISGILKSPQGSPIQNAEIIFEQTRTSTEVLAGTKFSIITNQSGNYSTTIGVGTFVFKVRFQDETQYRTVASNVIVTQSMNNYTLNQIIQDQSQLQDVDYDLLQDVIQARDQAAASAQAAQTSQSTASTKASEASSSAQAALASKNAAQTSEANALASKNAAQTSQTNAANSQTAAQSSQTAASGSQTTASTKATEAANSAQAALASKNAAATSEANALASKNQAQSSQTAAQGSQATATTKASEASDSQTQAQDSQTDSGASAQAAATSEANALASKNQAQTSQATATTKASEASTSAQAALASKNAAATSETNALASKNQAQTSQTNASNSQTAAAASQTTATTKASEASTSQTSAAGSQTTATTKASEASASQTSASGSQTTATTKASEASASQTSASGSQSTATTKAGEASASQTLAQKWAANPEDSVVSGGLYSALHYAAKAAQAAQTANGQLVWRGGWSAQAGNPPPTPTGTTQDFYRITQAGTILSVQYEVGDYIHWDNLNSIWFKMDGTDSVTSVNGRTGAVVIAKADVGLNLVNNWGASSQTNDASTTTYATTAGVKAAYDLAATKLTATANAVSATKLVTARTINGTNFDGTANITTANWGTSRNLTIGNTAKAVNGSQNVAWTLAEIGAAPDGFGLGAPTSVSSDANQLGIVSGFFGGGGDPAVNFYAKYQPLIQQGRQGGADGTGQLMQLQADHDTRTLAYRTRVGNIWTSWGVLYSNLNKPTAAELGVVSDTRTVNGRRLNTDITLTQDDVGTYTKEAIDGQSFQSITIQAPQGVEAGKYYPIVVRNYGSERRLTIETRSSGGADPMNFCMFEGIVQQGGWSDKGNYVDGQFTIYNSSERQIHSILGCTEADSCYAVYVEARAFPVTLRVRGSATVVCTGQDISNGTTLFTQGVTDPVANGGVGTKTRVLADFAYGNVYYNTSTLKTFGGIQTNSTVVVNHAKTDVGSLALGGNIQGYAEIAGKAVGQSGYNYDQGLRYYNDNTWRVGDKRLVTEGDATITGRHTFTQSSQSIIMSVDTAQSSYILGRKQGVDSWWVGRGSANSDDVTLYSYIHSNYVELKADRVVAGKDLYVGNSKVYHTGNNPTAADVGAFPIVGGTATGAIITSVSDAMAIRARRNGYWAMMGCSNVAGEYVFGGGADNVTDYQNYVRIGNNKLQFQTGGSAYNVFHEGYVPTAATVGALPSSGGDLSNKLRVIRSGIQGWPVNTPNDQQNYINRAIISANVNNNGLHIFGNGDTNARRMAIQSQHSDAQYSTAYGILDLNPFGGQVRVNGNDIYHVGNKPTPTDLGVVPTSQVLPSGLVSWQDMLGKIATINSGGVTEIARYLDMREQGSTVDFHWRWDAGAAGDNKITLYNQNSLPVYQLSSSGTITLTPSDSVSQLFVQGSRTGEDKAIVRGQVQGGAFIDWRARAAGLQVDCPNGTGAAYNVFKATHWGVSHICAFDVHRPSAGQAQAALHMGAVNNTFMFYENGQFHAGDVYIRSDRRLKSNFEPITGALAKVLTLQGSTYDKKQALDTDSPVTREAGIVAQDLQQTLPEAVRENVDGMLTISNSAVNALLLEAIKELKAEVDQLRRMINDT